MFKVNNKTPDRRHWRRSGVFIVNFEHISHLSLVFLLFNRDLNRGCLVYMFSLRFSASKILIIFRVGKIFRTQVFGEYAVFSFCV